MLDSTPLLFLITAAAGATIGFALGLRKRPSEPQAPLDRQDLENAFKAAAATALADSNRAFLQLAGSELDKARKLADTDLEKRQTAIESLLEPIKQNLATYDAKLNEIEKQRAASFSTLAEKIDSVSTMGTTLRDETRNLVNALRTPMVRGRWGELQLRRVAEMAGMLENCDFITQETLDSENGNLRPDMTVRLATGRTIIVDSKVSLDAYLNAQNTDNDEARLTYLKQHVQQIRTHAKQLSGKSYWEQFEQSPDFVVLFLPGEVFYSAALQQEPGLIEEVFGQQVLIATPTTLIALLKAAAHGWRQEQLTKNAQEISRLGKEMYERLAVMCGHFEGVGVNLGRAVKAYNDAVGSLESRVLVSARKFRELGVSIKSEIGELEIVDRVTKELN